MRSKVLLFDFDGTIACTEPYHRTARDMMLRPFGIMVDDWTPYLGDTDKAIFTEFKNKYNLTMDIQATVDVKLSIFKQLAIQYDLKPFVGIENLIKILPYEKIIVSRQREGIVRYFLQRWNLEKYFTTIYSLADSSETKADFIKSLGIPLEKCVFFDDIQDIVEETRKAGIYSVLVTNGVISNTDREYLFYGTGL